MAQANVPTNTSSLQPPQKPALSDNQHKRRDLVGRIAGLPVAAALAVPASAGEAADPHIEWQRQLDGIRKLIAGLPSVETAEDVDDREVIYRQEWALQGMILTTPAQTLIGLRLQLQEAIDLITEHHSTFGDERDLRCFQAALVTVEQMAGRA